MATELERHPDVFDCQPGRVTFAGALGPDEGTRSAAVARLLAAWRAAGRFEALAGWRNELYPVVLRGSVLHAPVVLRVERSGVGLFGLTSYGVHINGYTRTNGDLRLWIARRSATKQTWPNYLDNFVRNASASCAARPSRHADTLVWHMRTQVAGGQPVGVGLLDNVVKECAEEAGVPAELARRAQPVRATSRNTERLRETERDRRMRGWELTWRLRARPRSAASGPVLACGPWTGGGRLVHDRAAARDLPGDPVRLRLGAARGKVRQPVFISALTIAHDERRARRFESSRLSRRRRTARSAHSTSGPCPRSGRARWACARRARMR